MSADIVSLIAILASLSLWLVLLLIVSSYIWKKRIIHFVTSGAAFIAAVLNTATIIGGERSAFLTLIIVTLCAVSYLHLDEAVRQRSKIK